MSDQLCLTIHFLDGAFHGRADHGEPEWPPSPLRLYQAIVAAAAAQWRSEGQGLTHAEAALKWFEQLPPPIIVAPKPHQTKGYLLYVPDNAGDRVGKSWSRGGDDSIADYRTDKTVRPLVFCGEDAIHYLWSMDELPEGFDAHREVISQCVRSITHLGWGVDLVVADFEILNSEASARLKGEQWRPVDSGSRSLRAPRTGTFDDLAQRHQAFLNRVTSDGFAPVPALSEFKRVGYKSDSEPSVIPHAIFALRALDNSRFCAFDLPRRGLHVAGMFRHAANDEKFRQSVGWSEEEARRIVLGHGEERGREHQSVAGPRLCFLPLPSIEYRGNEKEWVVTSVRRVLVTMHGATDGELLNRFVHRFEGQEIIDEKKGAVAFVQRQSDTREPAIRDYFQRASTWATVTPVILPGYDDRKKLRKRLNPGEAGTLTVEEKGELLERLDRRIDSLLRRAIRQAGFSELMATHAELDWRASGFWPGTAMAAQYAVPEHHRRFRRLHLRITWRDASGQPVEIPGPVCIGGGKFTGMGLFAGVHERH